MTDSPNGKVKQFLQFIPRKYQPLTFTIVAALTLESLFSDIRGEINDLIHFSTSSVFILNEGDSFTTVSRTLIRYTLKAITICICAALIRRTQRGESSSEG